MSVHTKQKLTTYILLTKFVFQNVTPQSLHLNHLHTKQEVYGIDYQAVSEFATF